MCWAIPAKIIEIDGDLGKAEFSGTVCEVGLQLIDHLRVGDYVLIHAGFAIQKVDEREAQETLSLWQEMLQSAGGQDEVHR